jgi:hypothetical protein
MKTTLVIVSTILTILCTLPYIIDVIKLKTKPRIVSWFTWSLLSAIAGAASLSDHQYPAAILSFSATIETMVVVLLGLKYGEREFNRFDIVCQVAAIVGLVLWLVFNSPAIAVLASVAIDLIGTLPTIKHAWEKPSEETWITFAVAGIAATFTLMAASSTKITAIVNPIYLILINFVITGVLLSRHKVMARL